MKLTACLLSRHIPFQQAQNGLLKLGSCSTVFHRIVLNLPRASRAYHGKSFAANESNWDIDLLQEMRSSTNRKPVVGGAKRAPKTWTSTHGNRFEPSSSSSSSSSSTSAYSRAATKKQYRPNVFAPTAAQLARETERQELELGLEVYSHKSPAGPPHMYGTPFLAPLCKPWSSSFTLDSNLNHVTRNKTERLKAPLLAYTNNPDEAVDLLSCLGPGPMGLDLEWNVDFRKGAKPTALLQICSPVLIVIVHLSAMNHYIPPILRSILQDATIIKTGVAIKNDALKLQRDFGINTRNIVELSNLAKLAQPYRWKSAGPLIALRDLTRVYLGKKLSKDQVRTSDWERWPLSDQQVEYAASDTLVGLEVLRAICEYFKPATTRLVDGDNLVGKGKGVTRGNKDRLLGNNSHDDDSNEAGIATQAMELETALKLSSYDLHQERMEYGSANRTRENLRIALEDLKAVPQVSLSSAHPVQKVASVPQNQPSTPQKRISKTKPPPPPPLHKVNPAVPPIKKVKTTNKTDTNVEGESSDDGIKVTKVVRPHSIEAVRHWLYGSQTLTQVASMYGLDQSSIAFYLLVALHKAQVDSDSQMTETGSNSKAGQILKDFLPEQRIRLLNELVAAGSECRKMRANFRGFARQMGWNEIDTQQSDVDDSDQEKKAHGLLQFKGAKICDQMESSDDEGFSVTKVVLRSHERAMHRWLYENRTLAQVASLSKIKQNTTAQYLVKALMQAEAKAQKQGKNATTILDDFTLKQRVRLENELIEAGQSVKTSTSQFRIFAKRMGWNQVSQNKQLVDQGQGQGQGENQDGSEKVDEIEANI